MATRAKQNPKKVGIPDDREQYIHRVGRTARAGKEGRAWLLLAPYERPFLKELSSSGVDCCSGGPLCEKCRAKASPWNTIGANSGLPSSEGDDLGWCALVVVVTTAAADGDRSPLSALAVAMAMAWVAVVVSAA